MPKFVEIAPTAAEIWCFGIFQNGGRRHLDFWNFEFLTVGRVMTHECRTASPCQISSESFELRPRYVSFNIMLVCLENAYSRPFWFFGAHFPQMMSHCPNPKKDHLWAEPRHLSHKPEIFSYWFLNGPHKSPLLPIGLTLRGPRNEFLGVLNMVGVNISSLSSP